MAKKKKRKETKKKDTGYKVELIGLLLILIAIIGFIPNTGPVGEFISDFSVFLVGTWYNLLLAALMVVGVYMMIKREKPDFFTSKLIGLYIFIIGILVFSHVKYLENTKLEGLEIITETVNNFMASKSHVNVGGGIIGAIFSLLFVTLFALNGTRIVTLALLICGSVMFTGVSMYDAIKAIINKLKQYKKKEKEIKDKKEIEKRYDTIDILLKEFILKEDLANLLFEVYDLERLSGRIAFGNANAKDLLQLKSSLKVLPEISSLLTQIKFYKNFQPLDDLYELLEKSIYENPPISIKEGYLIKDGYNAELDELKSLRKGGKDFVARFEEEEKERTGIKNLKVGYNRVFGYYIEVSKGNTNLVKEEYGYERKQTLSNSERYISPILKEKEALILNAEEKIVELEYNLFIEIRNKIKEYIPKLQKIAKVISEIDVLQAFTTVAEENNYIRPIISENRNIKILDNRHPVVEKVINDEFVKNDIIMDDKTDILLITGPNMAGKSTYMRELAITVIMAQIGSFVPASYAELPIFDAIFTRIGASDDLVSGESTFMVEMNEAAFAISSATENSLILFDELGRGTATFDGMALAQSIIEYIHNNIKAKTLFSTHYHELTDLEDTLTRLKNVHVSAHEEDGKITFLHKVKKGSIDKSYGIHVARLANLPESLIKRASQILAVYENKEKVRDNKIQESLPLEELMEPKENEIQKVIDEINPLEITPLEALNILYDLKNKIRR